MPPPKVFCFQAVRVFVRVSVCPFVNTISYKQLVEISPNSQLMIGMQNPFSSANVMNTAFKFH